MKIAGLQKMTLLDYPGKVACTVFLQGCNLRCPFCHNSGLLDMAGEDLVEAEALLAFLEKRRGLLDGVCITGGEPTLQADLANLIRRIKALGYLVKLDTNGTRPEVLKHLVGEGLIDYVAMDIKNCPGRYAQTAGAAPMKQIEQSIRFLLTGDLDYELRTTVVEELHDEQSILDMGQWMCRVAPGHRPKRFFLQSYVDRDSVLSSGLHAPSPEKLISFANILAPLTEIVSIRGMD